LPSISDAIAAALLGAGLGTAALIDARHRRIPNVVSLMTLVAGIGLAASGLGGVSLASSVAGIGIGLLLMLPGHLLGGTGAGDVKLFAASGALLGAGRIVPAFLYTAIAGGVLAVAIAWQRGRLTRTVAFAARLCGRDAGARSAIESPAEHNRFPYGPAIAVGCMLAALA
jgi:prepilin peptidase CpaA